LNAGPRNGMTPFLALAIAGAFAVAPAAGKDTLVLLDGSSTAGDVASIDAAGQVHHNGRDGKVALQELRRITRSVKVTAPAGKLRIYLADGSRLVADKFKVEAGKLTVDWSAGKAMVLPLASVRGVLLPLDVKDKQAAAFEQQFLKTLDAYDDPRDALFVPRNDKLTEVRGALDAFGQDQATFIWNDKPRKIDRDKIFGVILAAGDAPDLTGQARATLSGGSTLWGKVDELAAGKLQLSRADGPTITLPWNNVARLDVRSDRMVFLSDLKPIRRRSAGIATLPTWPIAKDKSVMGNPLTLGGMVYERGLGTHANASIVYNVGR